MRFDILTLFPAVCEAYVRESIMGRAQESGALSVATHDLRAYTTDKHHKADDTPYGGGAGMVLKVEPIHRAVEAIRVLPPTDGTTRVILFSAKGQRYTQADARRLAAYDRLILICGRYEGVDERVALHIADEELSIGDFVLTGGELAALTVTDSVARLLPGVLGNETSAVTESHTEAGYLEHPQYTKPEIYEGWEVPPVLLSGHHGEIERWRREHATPSASHDSL